MAFLQELLQGVTISRAEGPANPDISGITINSREVSKGCLFIAMKGTTFDGHSFIEDAIRKGATAILCEYWPSIVHTGTTYIQTEGTRKITGEIAHRFYGKPSERMQVVGVTGTNGKTTVATLCYQLFQHLGEKCGLFSTVENRIGSERMEATHTTPDPVQLHRILRKMGDAGCTKVFMEISSHALDQDRIYGLKLAGAIFTNITHDHLDYHGTFRAYIDAKKKLFDRLKKGAFALINGDSRHAGFMVQNTRADVRWYALHSITDYSGRILTNSIEGLEMKVGGREVHFRLPGEYNASNLLAAYGCGLLLGGEEEEILKGLSLLEGPEGRMQVIRSKDRNITGIVDFAHSPDALEKLLKTVKELRQGKERIITLIGCGGDRDRKKRPAMGRIAAVMSDITILTSDNPRSEDAGEILQEMEAGVPQEKVANVLLIEDREQAIKIACQLAKEGDIIVAAGKGHEKYQEIKGRKLPFDDKTVLGKYLTGHTKM